jgi:hypothetical protein
VDYGVYYSQVLYKLEKNKKLKQVMSGLDKSQMKPESKALYEYLSSK